MKILSLIALSAAIACFQVAFAADESSESDNAPKKAASIDDKQWGETRCDLVAQENREPCMAAHVRLDIAPDRTLTPPTVRADNEALRAAMDLHLAMTLKDPMSAIQYMVSDAVECEDVSRTPASLSSKWCVCYSVNAKNSYGGFTGAQIGVATLIRNEPPYLMVDVPSSLITKPSKCPNMQSRDSALIHAKVK